MGSCGVPFIARIQSKRASRASQSTPYSGSRGTLRKMPSSSAWAEVAADVMLSTNDEERVEGSIAGKAVRDDRTREPMRARVDNHGEKSEPHPFQTIDHAMLVLDLDVETLHVARCVRLLEHTRDVE